jgi:hypothetical protein
VKPIHAQSVVPQKLETSKAMRSLRSYTLAPDMRFRSSSRCGRLRVIRSMSNSTLIGSGLFTIISVECPENLDLGLFTEQTCYILSAKNHGV